jgi:adenosylcobalamin-dependent ribonucleoside-diphosphate reductase
MLGLWFGDGSKDRLRVRFTNNDKKLHKYFVIGVSKFGLFKYGCYKNGNSAETTFNSKKLSSIFNHIGFFNKENIPATVFGWSDSLKVSFIEGLLDTDGSVKKQGHVCVVSNKNKQPILDVKTLLKTLGFSSYVSKINSGWSLYLYSCGIEDFAKLTTFNTRKKSLLSNIKSTVHHTVTRHDDIEFMLIENIETCNTKSMVDFEIENHTYNVKYLVTHNCGGGIGLHLSKLRPAGDMVKTTEGIASGPVSFMRVFDVTSEVIKQGSTRRGGNLGLLTITHPDIVEFIKCKNDENKLNNFNISISIPDSFMKSLKNDVDISLINPKTNKTVRKMSARQLFRLISESAWKNGEPGIVFWDKVQADNPTPSKGMLIKNLCGESDLLHGEACVLGSINLSKFVDREENKIIYSSLRKVVHHAVRFLDNVIDASDYPTKEIETTVKSNRKIGLGVMGFADTLFYLGIPYNSEEALKLAEEIMDFVNIEARKASSKLAEEKGNFPNIEESVLTPPLRNANLTTIAPTGSLSILAECSSGIEPTYGLVFVRKILDGRTFFEVSKSFEDIGKREGWFSQELVNKIANNNGSIRGIEEIPEKWQNIFVTAHEISPEYHVRIQSSFQKHTNSSISKTVNLPSTATVEDVEKIIKMAYDLNLKGLTVFRDGSRSEQVLSKPLCAECDVGICKL